MAVSGIARLRFFTVALAVGFGGLVIGAGTTFILGLGLILIGGVIYTSPSAVIEFTAEYPLILLLCVSSCFSGMAFFVWRRTYIENDSWSFLRRGHCPNTLPTRSADSVSFLAL